MKMTLERLEKSLARLHSQRNAVLLDERSRLVKRIAEIDSQIKNGQKVATAAVAAKPKKVRVQRGAMKGAIKEALTERSPLHYSEVYERIKDVEGLKGKVTETSVQRAAYNLSLRAKTTGIKSVGGGKFALNA